MLRSSAWLAAPLLSAACLSTREALSDLEERKDDKDVAARLEKIQKLREDGPSDLDPLQRCRVVALMIERADVDPSRIVRSKSIETIATLLPTLPGGPIAFATRPVDEAQLDKTIDPLVALSTAEESRRATIRAQHDELAAAVRALSEARPELLSLSNRLLFLATRTASEVQDEALQRELEGTSTTLARHGAFLVGRKVLLDSGLDVRISGMRLLLAVDPVAATIEIGRNHLRGARSTDEAALEEVAMLKAMSDCGLRAVSVHPSLRPVLVGDLENDNAAVSAWSRICVAKLLGVDPEHADVKDLRTRWLALGDWDAAAPRS